ncbi:MULTISPECIES: hypothetical protein [unclassified Bradyrhizobium]|uniref:hypothetical protein n=1 Tax=unclassified Bradyrhizobium TaxID=2631580 RepID=UPI0028EA5665|nr:MULTISPECIES: hypothetical protein [unclassified Bradyrhizobium]
MTERHEVPWEGQCTDAAYQFGLQCAKLVAGKPHNVTAPLDFIINCFMTELWDRNFGQSEIRAAFEGAISDLPRYAAGEERRSSTSAELATADWRMTESP